MRGPAIKRQAARATAEVVKEDDALEDETLIESGRGGIMKAQASYADAFAIFLFSKEPVSLYEAPHPI